MNCVPDYIFSHVGEITIEFLKEKNIKGLIIDVDNTLARHNVTQPEPHVLDWLEELKAHGLKLILVSNNNDKRIKPFANLVDCNFVSSACKPMKKAYKFAGKILGIEKEYIAGIGDQIFTDIWGANRYGCISILVEPIHCKEITAIRMKRGLEKIFIRLHDKRKGIQNG